MAIKLPPATSHPRSEGIQTAALVANGTIHNYAMIAPLVRNYDYCVAVDGGLKHCKAIEIVPDLIIGDFDSVDKELLLQYEGIPLQTFSEEKDDTDIDLAVKEMLVAGAQTIALFGATEGRSDHALYNLHLLQRYPGKMIIESDHETIFVIEGEKEVKCAAGQTVSLMPLGQKVEGVTTRGLKWELKNATLDSTFMSLSNICLQESFRIKVAKGPLLCCLVRPRG